MAKEINNLPQKNFQTMFNFKRSLKSSQMIEFQGINQPVEWSIQVYQKNNKKKSICIV
jgi:hypothetical protein